MTPDGIAEIRGLLDRLEALRAEHHKVEHDMYQDLGKIYFQILTLEEEMARHRGRRERGRRERGRRERRSHGLCAEAGCSEKSGDAYRCDGHAAEYAARVKRHRERKAAVP